MALLRGRVDGLGVSYQVLLQRASAIGENKFTQLTMRSEGRRRMVLLSRTQLSN